MRKCLNLVLIISGSLLVAGDTPIYLESRYGRASFKDIAAADGKLFAATATGLEVFSFADGQQSEIGVYELYGRETDYRTGIVSNGRFAFFLYDRFPYSQWYFYNVQGTRPVLYSKLPVRSHAHMKGQLVGDLFLEIEERPNASHVRLYDISNPNQLAEVWSSEDVADQLLLSGNLLFMVWRDRIETYSLTDPSSPRLLSTLRMSGLVQVEEDRLFVGRDTIEVFDITNPAAPRQLGTTPLSGRMVRIHGDQAYVLDQENRLTRLDITDPLQPVRMASVIMPNAFDVMAIDASMLYVLHQGQLQVYDAEELDLLRTVEGDGRVYDQALLGQQLYLMTEKGLEVVDVSTPHSPSRVGTLPGQASGRIAVSPDRLLHQVGHNLTHLLDLQTGNLPVNPRNLFHPEAWALALYGDHAYLANSAELRIFELSGPQPVEVGQLPLSPRDLGHILDRTVNLYVDEPGRRLLAVNYNFGCAVFDLKDPLRPQLTANLSAPGIKRAAFVRGDFAWVATDTGGVHVFDLRTTGEPVAWIGTEGTALDIAMSGNTAYIADGLAGISIFDVADPMIPRFKDRLPLPGNTTHVSAVDDLLFVGGDIGLSIYRVPEDYHTTVVPWVVDNQDFSASLALFNSGAKEEKAILRAVSHDGIRKEKTVLLPPGRVRSFSAGELFATLSGYSLFISATSRVYPTFQIHHTTKGSPARTIGASEETFRSGLLFGRLTSQSAIVLVTTEPETRTLTTIRLSDEQGQVLAEKTVILTGRQPRSMRLLNLFAGHQAGVVRAITEGGVPIAGTSFTFNELGEPSMARAISYEP